jgi:hypothetical protein
VDKISQFTRVQSSKNEKQYDYSKTTRLESSSDQAEVADRSFFSPQGGVHASLRTMNNSVGWSTPMDNSKPDFSNLDQYAMLGFVELLKQTKQVDNRQLAKYLRKFAGQPIPKEVIEYTCQVLEGEVKPLRGRRPRLEFFTKLRSFRYSKNLEWLQKRLKGKKRPPQLGKGKPKRSKFSGSLHELAAELACRQIKGVRHPSIRTIINDASALKRRRPK